MASGSSIRWGIQVHWQPRAEWTLADGGERLARALRAVATAFPDRLDTVRLGDRKKPTTVADPGLGRALVPLLRASRNKNLFADNDLLGDATLTVLPEPYQGLGITFAQFATTFRYHESFFRVEARFGHDDLLVADPPRLVALIDELASILSARNAWLDMVHVRQEWNRWHTDCPVYGWATWLHPDWATVDTTGLDVEERAGSGGGRLLVLPVDVAAMADPSGTTGRDTIRELARRTVFADGTRLVDVNEYLREALAQG
jgi:hypothetical protein